MKNFEEFLKIDDKFSAFATWESITKYAESIIDFIKLFNYLNDNQKLEIMGKDYYKQQKKELKVKAISTISNDDIKIGILNDTVNTNEFIDEFVFSKIVMSMIDDKKIQVIGDVELLKKYNISNYVKKEIIEEMSDEKIYQIMMDNNLLKKLELGDFEIAKITCKINDDNKKYHIINNYKLSNIYKTQIIESMSYKYKLQALENEKDLEKHYIKSIIASFSMKEYIEYFKTNKHFLKNKGIDIFEIVKIMNIDKKLQFIEHIDKFQLTESEKRRIFAGIDNKTKEKISLEKVQKQYRDLLKLKVSDGKCENIMQWNKVTPDLNILDLNLYKDLDDILYVNPITLCNTKKDIKKVLELCEICPKLNISDEIGLSNSTVEEFREGEKWIQSVFDNMQSDWSDVQKIAYIDTEIGRKISYTPEFGTGEENAEDARALWRIISSGYGVCNGIAQIEKYMLKRIGIESELISSGKHSYILVKNIEIPTEDGIKKGNTLMDPTWNLATSRFGGKPQHFCKSYEELRKVDVLDGVDYKSHKNDKLEEIPTIDMDEKSLREVYKSIGLADEKGNFPIVKIIEKVKEIDDSSKIVDENIYKKFSLLKEICPECTNSINSTIVIMKDVLFENNVNFKFKNAVASRVYERGDSDKKAVLFVYFEFEDNRKMFFYGDKVKNDFLKLPQQDFEKRFSCYDLDKEKAGNKNLWDIDKKIDENKDLSSGKVMEGEER